MLVRPGDGYQGAFRPPDRNLVVDERLNEILTEVEIAREGGLLDEDGSLDQELVDLVSDGDGRIKKN